MPARASGLLLPAGPRPLRPTGFTAARLCSSGSDCQTPFPTVLAPMRPYDSLTPIGLGSGSPCLRPTSRRMTFLRQPPRAPADAAAVGDSFAAPRRPQPPKEAPGSPRLPGRPLDTCRGRTPRRPRRTLAHLRLRHCCLQAFRNPGLKPEFRFRWLHSHGPHLRLPTHQRRRCRRRCKAGYQPAGLSFSWTGFAPAGRLLQVSGGHRLPPSSQTGRAWSHPEIRFRLRTGG